MNKKWFTEKVITREVGTSMFIDLFVANIVSIALLTPIAFAHGGIYLVFFFLGIILTARATSSYARKIFPEKRSGKDAKNGKGNRPERKPKGH